MPSSTDAAALAQTHRHRDLAWVREAGGVRPRRVVQGMNVAILPAAEPTLHARYGADAPWVWLIRPDGHLTYSGARPRTSTGYAATWIESMFGKRRVRPEGRPIRAQLT
jgi:hypothetical protein